MSTPGYSRRAAAQQMGVSVYKIDRMIAAGQLPHKPTEEDVAKRKAKNDKALETYRVAIIKAWEAGYSLEYCKEMVRVATDNLRLWLPAKAPRVRDFVELTVYDHIMEVNRNDKGDKNL